MSNLTAIRFKKWNIFNEQLMKVWNKYNSEIEMIGQTKIFKKKKLFKTVFEEKIVSDSWIECSFDFIDKDNTIRNFKNNRIRDFNEFDEIAQNIQKTILTKPDTIIKNFVVKCETSYIDKQL